MAEKKTTTKKVVKKTTTTKKTAPKKAVKKTTKKAAVKKTVSPKTTAKKITVRKKTAKNSVKKSTTKSVVTKKIVKKNPAKKSGMSIWSRFWRVFTPTFLQKLGQEKSAGKSWGFWFLSNFILVLVPVVLFFIFQSYFIAAFPENLIKQIPETASITLDSGDSYMVKDLIKNAEFILDASGSLTTKNIPDPLVLAGNKKGKNSNLNEAYSSLVNVEPADFAIILDTKNSLDFNEVKEKFASYFYITKDKAIVNDAEKRDYKEIPYKAMIADQEITDFPKTFNYHSLAKMRPFLASFLTIMVLMMAVVMYIFLAIFRLINVLFWALIFWAIGLIVRIKNWDFDKAVQAMLHFSFVSMLFVPLAFIFNMSVFSYAAILFAILFGMNFWEMEKKK